VVARLKPIRKVETEVEQGGIEPAISVNKCVLSHSLPRIDEALGEAYWAIWDEKRHAIGVKLEVVAFSKFK
jgi:hypothetical protein